MIAWLALGLTVGQLLGLAAAITFAARKANRMKRNMLSALAKPQQGGVK